jgi:hypothetical protein
MVGAITARDILAHPMITIRCFGWRVFFKAMFAGHHQTFLALLSGSNVRQGADTRLSALIDRSIELERRARRVYAAFAQAFADRPLVSRFFDSLAQQEENHAYLLALCSAAARNGGWLAEPPSPWENYIPALEKHLDLIETALNDVGTLGKALQLVVQLESGEINRVFEGVLAACDPAFTRRSRAFQRAVESHISYIARWLPKLDPELTASARELRNLFPQRR